MKVLAADGAGTISGVISGIQWAVNDAKASGLLGKSASLSLPLICSVVHGADIP